VFTGIVQQQGTLVSREIIDGDARLMVDVPPEWAGRTAIGDSVAVNGVCLTVVERRGNALVFDASS
jgi:riboflavin synthase